jgi:hypothetical protein
MHKNSISFPLSREMIRASFISDHIITSLYGLWHWPWLNKKSQNRPFSRKRKVRIMPAIKRYKDGR